MIHRGRKAECFVLMPEGGEPGRAPGPLPAHPQAAPSSRPSSVRTQCSCCGVLATEPRALCMRGALLWSGFQPRDCCPENARRLVVLSRSQFPRMGLRQGGWCGALNPCPLLAGNRREQEGAGVVSQVSPASPALLQAEPPPLPSGHTLLTFFKVFVCLPVA